MYFRDVEKTKHVQNTKSTSKLSNKMAKDQAIQTEKKEKEIMPEDLTTTGTLICNFLENIFLFSFLMYFKSIYF